MTDADFGAQVTQQHLANMHLPTRRVAFSLRDNAWERRR